MIIKPIITEKTITLADKLNQYTFEVSPLTNKTEAGKALAKQFNVTVESVRVSNRLGQTFRIGRDARREGKHADRKIMIFKLKAGDKIDAFIQ